MSARRIFWTSFIVVLGVVFVGYVFESKKPQPAAAPTSEAILHPITPIADGNGLHYFPAAGEQYRRALSQFYADHPDTDCAYQGATEQNLGGGLHRISGHILHCRDITTSAQDITVP